MAQVKSLGHVSQVLPEFQVADIVGRLQYLRGKPDGWLAKLYLTLTGERILMAGARSSFEEAKGGV